MIFKICCVYLSKLFTMTHQIIIGIQIIDAFFMWGIVLVHSNNRVSLNEGDATPITKISFAKNLKHYYPTGFY